VALSGKKTLPMMADTLALPGTWGAFFGQSGFRLYPYQLGATVRADSAGAIVPTNGLGEFVQNDYVMACRTVGYGGSMLYIPDVTRISRIVSDPASATDDELILDPAIAVVAGEYLFNLGADQSAAPTAGPQYDGSTISIYEDNVGTVASAYKYLTTGQGGVFRGWLSEGVIVADLLIADASGVPRVVWPFYPIGPEVI